MKLVEGEFRKRVRRFLKGFEEVLVGGFPDLRVVDFRVRGADPLFQLVVVCGKFTAAFLVLCLIE